MCRLVESIRIENKQLQNIDLHNERFNNARKAMFGKSGFLHLEEMIDLSRITDNKIYKCRVVSDGNKFDVTFDLYEQRKIETLKIVVCNQIDYTYKTDDRSLLSKLFEQRGTCDDIIIIKNGFVTDSYTANILFFDGTAWFTPSHPLLKGVQREYLLRQGIISESIIRQGDIGSFSKIKLVNALIDLERAPIINVPGGVVGLID